MADHMASPLECVVYVYKQFIQRHYLILSVSLTVEKWQLDGVLTDAAERDRVGERECARLPVLEVRNTFL